MKYESTVLSMIAFALILTATSATAQTYTPLFTYPGASNNTSGITWPGLISQGRDGDFYSTNLANGAKNHGSVYKMTTTGQYTLLNSFCLQAGCADGTSPYGGVTLGTDGDLYGTTGGGGLCGVGTIFKVTSAGAWTKLWDFTAGTTCNGHTGLKDEGYPYYPPFEGQDGNFYGTDVGVYAGTYGVFYKVTPKGMLTPYPFNYTDGALPNLPTQGTDGNFYGITKYGGSKNLGVVYKITPAGKITVLHNFTGYVSSTVYDGTYPLGVLVQGNDGNFYGTTYEGGAYNEGSVFKISASGVYTLLYSFHSVSPTFDGQVPWAGLVLGSDGNFYGTTQFGGKNNGGTIFKITPAGNETLEYNFCSVAGCADGFNPITRVVQHTNGKFYGNTTGNSLGGSVFYSLDMGLAPFAQLVLWSGKVGATAEILGQGFTGTTHVAFNGTPASFTVVSDTYLTATVPSGATTGFVDVTTPGGTLKSNHTFLVTPTILSFSPASGKIGATVTITGSGLTGATKVTFGGKASLFTVNNSSKITATVPTGAKTGKIVVTTAGGTATSATSFSVTP
jgi:uncharacterized repeat protein (TIGR03803 family)